MKKRFRFGLRTQLVLAMFGSIVVTAGVTIVVGDYLDKWVEQEFSRGLSPEAVKANEEVEAFELPDNKKATQELLAKSKIIQQKVVYANYFFLPGIALLSILLSSLIAIFVANRIGRPVDEVSLAATQVASGNLSIRANTRRNGSGETARLIENFNHMAASLERFERQSVESSAAIAHELRTPLTILRGRLQGMLDGIFGREGRDIELLIGQVDSLTQIVNDLNIVSLANAGRLGVMYETIDLAIEIDALLKLLKPNLESAGFRLTMDLQASQTRADPNRIRQATLALIENARVHAASGLAVHVQTFVDNKHAVIRVSDRGVGLPHGDPALLFEPFWRGDTSRNRASGGSGLGLSVVVAIAEAHRGSVHALPRDGGGATFEIRLPQ